MKLFLLKIEISSDSGVGPYTEIKTICNCTFTNGNFYASDGLTIQKKYHTGFADCHVTVLSIEQQETYYYI